MLENPNILVIRFSSLGDIILTTPVYKNLKNHWPNCRITVAVKEKYASILEGNIFVDQLLILKNDESVFSFVRRVKKQKFDILIDLHNNFRSNFISLFSKIPRKIQYKKAFWERRIFVKRKVFHPELQRHTIDRYLDTLKTLGIEPKFHIPELCVKGSSSLPASGFIPYSSSLRILIVQTAYLGDAVLTTPIFEALRKFLPSSRISVLCTPEIKEIFAGNKNIDELLVMDKRGKDARILSLLKWSQKLKNKFDVALVPHRSFRSAFLVWLAKIPSRIGFNNSQGKIFLTDLVHFDWKSHDSERNLKLLEVLGIKNVQPQFQIPHPNSEFTFENFLSTYKISKDAILVGINPGTMWNTKRWLPERFAEVANRLMDECNCKVLIFGSNRDTQTVESVVKSMKRPAINLCGKTDLKTLTSLISHCSLFITNDSGPMHIACATQVPVVAIFGATTRELGFFPYGEKSVVIELNLPCRPCSLHGGKKCPLEHFKCMKDLTAEMVLQPCRKFLSEITSVR